MRFTFLVWVAGMAALEIGGLGKGKKGGRRRQPHLWTCHVRCPWDTQYC